MHKVKLASEYASGLNSIYSICCPWSFPLIACSYLLVLKILSRIQAPSPRHQCGSVIPSPPAPYFLEVPTLQFKTRHPPRNGGLCSPRDDLEQAFLHHLLPFHGPSISPPHYASCRLVDKVATLHPEAPKLSTAKVAIIWLRSSTDTFPGRA